MRRAATALWPAWTRALVLAVFFVLSGKSNAQVQAQFDKVGLDPSSLCKVVAQKRVLEIAYGYDPPDAHVRVVHPYGVGYTQKRYVLLFGRQVEGYSKSAESGSDVIPGWRNFRTDRIRAIAARNDLFVSIPAPSIEYRAIQEFVCRIEPAFRG
jgi:hypothetical protein